MRKKGYMRASTERTFRTLELQSHTVTIKILPATTTFCSIMDHPALGIDICGFLSQNGLCTAVTLLIQILYDLHYAAAGQHRINCRPPEEHKSRLFD